MVCAMTTRMVQDLALLIIGALFSVLMIVTAIVTQEAPAVPAPSTPAPLLVIGWECDYTSGPTTCSPVFNR